MELTKTDILNNRRCPKLLWLSKHRPEQVVESEDAMRRAKDGLAVGDMSRKALGNRIIWMQSEKTHQQSAAHAKVVLAQNIRSSDALAAVEVPMWADNVYCRADAMAPGAKGYRIQETKAKTWPKSNKPDSDLVADIAIQAWTMQKSDIPYEGADLVLLNRDFVYQGDGDYSALLRVMDVSAEVDAQLPNVDCWIEVARATVQAASEPEMQMGSFCNDPPCPFKQHCEAQDMRFYDPDKTPISVLPDIGGKNLARRLLEKGYKCLQEVPTHELAGSDQKATDLYRRIQRAHTINHAIRTAQASQLIDSFAHPHAHFDFEGIDFAIPIWKGLRPYQQVAFQFSVHVQTGPGAELVHREFLDTGEDDPTLRCIEAMRECLPETGTIFVYHKSYEVTRLKEMQARHPEHHELIQGWIDRVVDLLPLVKQNFYHPIQRGSFSIKKVLPAFSPRDDYEDLEGVRNGTQAQLAYLRARAANDAETGETIRVQMLAYCKQDTQSMVILANGLRNSGEVGQ